MFCFSHTITIVYTLQIAVAYSRGFCLYGFHRLRDFLYINRVQRARTVCSLRYLLFIYNNERTDFVHSFSITAVDIPCARPNVNVQLLTFDACTLSSFSITPRVVKMELASPRSSVSSVKLFISAVS